MATRNSLDFLSVILMFLIQFHKTSSRIRSVEQSGLAAKKMTEELQPESESEGSILEDNLSL